MLAFASSSLVVLPLSLLATVLATASPASAQNPSTSSPSPGETRTSNCRLLPQVPRTDEDAPRAKSGVSPTFSWCTCALCLPCSLIHHQSGHNSSGHSRRPSATLTAKRLTSSLLGAWVNVSDENLDSGADSHALAKSPSGFGSRLTHHGLS